MTTAGATPEDLLAPFHALNGGQVCISAAQGSRFAKHIAGDHNPLHDEDSSRFCVPGDLLFALIVQRCGMARVMRLQFRGMLRGDTPLIFPDAPSEQSAVTDTNGREYVITRCDEPLTTPPAALRGMIEQYVACSGQTFPGLLQPLLRDQGVMFNPERPLVVYDSMGIQLEAPLTVPPAVRLRHSELTVNGKRGEVDYQYDILQADQIIGECWKKMLISGLRPYEHAAMASMIDRYRQRAAAAAG